MMRWIFLMLAISVTPAMAECQSSSEPITGRLARLETLHPTGQKIMGWVLLPYETCVTMELMDGEIADLIPKVIQLVFEEGSEPKDLMSFAVEEVTARGELIEAHTAWHLGDVVMLNAKIITK